MPFAVHDYPAIKAAAVGLKTEPPQNVIAPPVVPADEPEWHVYWPAASHVQYEVWASEDVGC
jgi:hypothetical protein